MQSPSFDPQARHLILLGGGHSHAMAVRMLAMRPLPGVRVTLVSEVSAAPYSGMLPGHISGVYSWEEMHIDLRRLCAAAGVTFIHAAVEGLDPATRTVFLTGRPPLSYDVLSINTGGTPRLEPVPGAAEFAIPAKPVPQLLDGWTRIRTAAQERPVRVVVVGGGAGGVELALCMQRQLGERAELTLVHRGETLMDSHPARVRAILTAVLQERNIRVITSVGVTEVKADQVLLSGTADPVLDADFVIWVTSASPAPWLAPGGLAVDSDGAVKVSACLQSISHPDVFAVGDAAALPEHLPRSGVYAVRMARPLVDNLRRFFSGTALRPWHPQRSFLSLIGTADGQAVASRRPWALRSAWLWQLKDHIDRKFMRQFENLPEMKVPRPHPAPAVSLREQAALRCRGCAAKIGPRTLTATLERLRKDFPDVVTGTGQGGIEVGLEAPDDAAVFSIPPAHRLVQTVDYLPALMDDPFVFGQVAALHSFSDVFAMGAEPHSCLATALVPFGGAALTGELLYQLLAGVLTVLRESGARLLGGHTAEGSPMALTLVCNGLAPAGRLLTKGGLRAGDALILTKPLGIGVLYAAAMRRLAQARWLDAAERSMLRSNLPASRILRDHGASGCTDVTGFGLAGHLQEMLRASGCGAKVQLDALPLVEGALEASRLGIRSSLHGSNAAGLTLSAESAPFAEHAHFPLLFDPQTSGGLLAGVAAGQVESCLAAMHAAGYPEAAVIGQITAGPPHCPVLTFS